MLEMSALLGALRVLEASWSHLGDILERLRGVLERLGGILEHLGGVLERLEGVLERLGGVLAAPKAPKAPVLMRLGVVLKESWSLLKAS